MGPRLDGRHVSPLSSFCSLLSSTATVLRLLCEALGACGLPALPSAALAPSAHVQRDAYFLTEDILATRQLLLLQDSSNITSRGRDK